MNKHKSSDINWLNVINIRDFQTCVDFISLKEISMASKLTREKLKPALFQRIALKSNSLIFIFNSSRGSIFIDFYKYFYFPELVTELPVYRKDLNIQSDLKEISNDLIDIRKYVKSFNLDGLNRSGYFLYKIINNFHSLKLLELSVCTIPYSEFARIGESLPNLTSIKLVIILFAMPLANNTTLDNFIFPHKLNYLELYGCGVIISNPLSRPYEFLFYENTIQETNIHFNFPTICIPSLKHLKFFTSYLQDGGLKEFLKVNPNLESLHIESQSFSAIKSLNSLNSLRINDNISFDGRSTIQALKFLKKLEIEIQWDSNYSDINNLSALCSNLEYLHITMRGIEKLQQIIDTCIAPIIANFSLLKTLQLTIYKEEYDTIDISKFNQIEKLVLKSSVPILLNVDFTNCSILNNIELTSYSGDIEKSIFIQKFNSYKNWIFKYFNHTIRGYKVNN